MSKNQKNKTKQNSIRMGTATFVDIIIAILLPPLGVFLKFGCEAEFWICLILTIFGYLPGIIYAIYILTKNARGLIFDSQSICFAE
ncbi:Low temperature and salt responsive protein family [Prunus dulcis]|uniref:Low temperature and salt responsive protein family n=3 Tax=fabids TaxID=91835 RepID=A0A4Y1RRH4_PRUDU|nr:Low temperature and salt responsive protein family [Prunus dulcis]BBN68652.1 Low temperature and salt responsive protein family [Prunus dulcis]